VRLGCILHYFVDDSLHTYKIIEISLVSFLFSLFGKKKK
jgi:hypothetical protein